jgi:hypothetical protein
MSPSCNHKRVHNAEDGDMKYKDLEQNPRFRTEKKAMRFNVSKMQAAGCVLLSVLASTGLIYFGATAFI